MKRKIVLISSIIIVLLAWILWRRAGQTKKSEFTSAPVTRGTLEQRVEGSGTVTAATDANLNFEITGTVARVHLKVGDHIKKDQLIAQLKTENLDAEATQSSGAFKRAQANLAQSLAPSTSEVLDQYRADVEKAQANLNKARVDLENAKASTGQSLDDANANMISSLQGALAPLETSANDIDTILGVVNTTAGETYKKGVTDLDNRSTYVSTAKSDFASSRTKLSAAKKLVNGLVLGISKQSDVDAAIAPSKDALVITATALNDTWTVLDKLDLGVAGLIATTVNASKTTIDADRSSVNAKLSAVLAQEQKLISAKLNFGSTAGTQNVSSVAQAEANAKIYEAALTAANAALAQKEAKPREVDIGALRAAVEEARGAYDNAIANREKAFLRAPFDGTVTVINYKLGEQTNLAKSFASLFADNEFRRIEVHISENDIARTRLKQPAQIILDALGQDHIFYAEVTAIDPAQTVISDVVYYKVTLQIEGKYRQDKTIDMTVSTDDLKEIRPGMTANVTISTAYKEGVLMIPERAIIERGGIKYARRIIDIKKGLFEEREVKTGLRGGDSQIEIIEGLNDGDQIVTFLKAS
ncbi:MAG: HlyD family efflux transporter periplasmic adaptor subunit [Candidatus Magasanikbacteria bacterium]|nr:HlyD family efflux transporter periplasmic adaptor subunit [Candidatus Magasanikbacteria bacterium]